MIDAPTGRLAAWLSVCAAGWLAVGWRFLRSTERRSATCAAGRLAVAGGRLATAPVAWVAPTRPGGSGDQLGDGVGMAEGADAPDDGAGVAAPAADDAAGLVDEAGAALAAALGATLGAAEVVTEAAGVGGGDGEWTGVRTPPWPRSTA